MGIGKQTIVNKRTLLLFSLFTLLDAQSYSLGVKISPEDLAGFRESGIDFILAMDDLVLTKGDVKTISRLQALGLPHQILVRAKDLPGGGIYKVPITPILPSREAKPFAPKFDTLIQQMVNKVSSDTILAFVRRLQDFRTRYSPTDSARAAAEFIKNIFLSYGLDSVYTQTFRPDFAPNVIGIKKGRILPDRMYVVICGHFDSYSDINPHITAPGADDNGSGTAAVLEAARILKDYDFDRTIRFIAFSGEEQGLLGSFYYCSLARYVNQDSIIGAINCDMIAYTLPNRDSASVIGSPTNPNCAPLVDYFISCANTYTDLKCQRQVIHRPRSDHASFNRFGYLAVHIRENLSLFNPYYHTPGDTIGAGFNDLNFVTEVIKASLATTASLALPRGAGIKEEAELHSTGEGKSKYTSGWNVYNIFGQLVKHIPYSTLPNPHQRTAVLKGYLPSGVYFLISKDERSCQKIVMVRGKSTTDGHR